MGMGFQPCIAVSGCDHPAEDGQDACRRPLVRLSGAYGDRRMAWTGMEMSQRVPQGSGAGKTDFDCLLADFDSLYFVGLVDLLSDADAAYREQAGQQANSRALSSGEFNIFTLTERANFEVTTHQRILADLLNPLGTHRQGNFFLQPFLKLVRHKTGIAQPPADGLWEVDQRDYIVVRSNHPKKTSNPLRAARAYISADECMHLARAWGDGSNVVLS
jgi:PD-(D/E)XK nuclease superfamily